MRKKKSRITITWDDKNEHRLEVIAREFQVRLDALDIKPYTTTSPKHETAQPNTSGIIQFALMVLAGEIDLSDGM